MMSNSDPPQRNVQDAGRNPAEQPVNVNRACEACRMLKVRCLPDEGSESTICQRCKRIGRMCVYAAPQKRKQRIRTDTRVAILEREIRAMRALLTGGNSSIDGSARISRGTPVIDASKELVNDLDGDRSTPTSTMEEQSSGGGRDLSWQPSSPDSQLKTPDGSMFSMNNNTPAKNVDENNAQAFLSTEKAMRLFESYRKDLAPHYPAVIFSEHSNPEGVRLSKPILFQAAVTAAACQSDPDLFQGLFMETTKLYAQRIFINGEKSLELIQSLTLTAVWYCPPADTHGHNLQFYQYIHMAATMAVDLGIGMKVDMSMDSLEESRTLLSCYLTCVGVAMRMRRPNMFQWTDGMNDCLEVLEKSPFATFEDKRFIAWVKLQRVSDEWNTNNNPNGPTIQVKLKVFEKQLEKWKECLPSGVLNASLILAYQQDSIYFHESVLEGGSTTLLDFNHKHFSTASTLKATQPDEKNSGPISAAYLEAVIACVDSCHALLNESFAMDLQTLRAAPIIVYVRMSYSLVVLVKRFAAATDPASELGQIFDLEYLRLDFYINRLTEKLKEAAGPQKLTMPNKWLTIIYKISGWYNKVLMAFNERGKQMDNQQLDSVASDMNAESSTSRAHGIGPTAVNTKSWSSPSTYPHLGSNQEHTLSQPSSTTRSIPYTSATLPHTTQRSSSTSTSDDHSFTGHNSMMDYMPMDYTQGDFSFANNANLISGDFDAWAPEGDIDEMGYEAMGNDWDFDFQ